MNLSIISTADLLHVLCQRRLGNFAPVPDHFERALRAVAKATRIHAEDITSRSQRADLTYPRYIVFYLMLTAGCSKSTIAAAFGFTHGTVQNGLTRFWQRYYGDTAFIKITAHAVALFNS